MVDNNRVHKKYEEDEIIFKENADCISQYADEFGYSSFSVNGRKIGSMSFFKYVIKWIDDENTSLTREAIANIQMPDYKFMQLAEYILEQHYAILVAVCAKIVKIDLITSRKLRPIYYRPRRSLTHFIISRLARKHLDFSIFICQLHCDLFLCMIKARKL